MRVLNLRKTKQPVFWVDIPQKPPIEDWQNVANFPTRDEAIKYAQDHFGADEDGNVCLVTG